MFGRKRQSAEYPDDIFDSSRMSFGDHLDELRTRMLRAVFGLVFFLFIGFILDGIGDAVGNQYIGVGKPMLRVITDPVESQVRDFYYRRTIATANKFENNPISNSQEDVEQVREKLAKNNYNLNSLTEEEKQILFRAPEEIFVSFPAESFTPVFGPPKEGAPKEIVTKMRVSPVQLSYLANKGEALAESKQYLTTLSAQEAFVVYFKVSIICGIILASPWILFQFWAFVGAGLYPHEKKYVYTLFWPSVLLFLGGVLLCQFAVLPGAVKALLKFNEWLGFDPDIRLNEWLGLALILPLVFGISFQTPLVMIALNRLGMFTADDYLKRWRGACFLIALFAAIITPTPDPVTMMYLFIPMFGLYLLGIVFCHYFPGTIREEEDIPAEEIAV